MSKVIEKPIKKRGRKARVPSYKITEITVSKIAMDNLGINLYEAAILNVIEQYQKNETIVKGFCMEEKKQIARDVGLTDIAVLNYLKKLEEKELIIRTDKTLQVSKKYLQALKASPKKQNQE
ncbi:MAG: hypothetical protein OHK0045_22880 [Raineya sp.]